ncbi:DgyrCDS13 [Dimorphilus gyrociliatus]|uniref:Ecdysone receptor n=1 Tax=Dimorphilus gyrociliatus TaxID=2664684 RepID=A0A7I8V3I3_9ANNE|nr:DgyrCDS13 [Dimorphilus gyrociliatus]
MPQILGFFSNRVNFTDSRSSASFSSASSASPDSTINNEAPKMTSPKRKAEFSNGITPIVKRIKTEIPDEEVSDASRLQNKKKLGVSGKTAEDELCSICGDRASGYHYNALSCEGCKGFFRRSITRDAKYLCKNGGDCEMDMWMRRKCQACRLRKCKAVGMKEECLLSEEQCRARDARRKKKKQPDEQQPSPDSNSERRSCGPTTSSPQETVCSNPMEKLPIDVGKLVETVVGYQDKFELPTDEDVEKISRVRVSGEGKPKDMSEMLFKNMAEMTILTTHLIVDFAKHLPGFLTLDREDQITLLKGSACEVMMIRTARRYDLETNTVVFADGAAHTEQSMSLAGLNEFVASMFEFCRGLGKLRVDNAEYALLTAISIFSDRPGLKYSTAVMELQERYAIALQEYDKLRRPKKSNYFAKLILQLCRLRELSAEHSQVLFSLKVEKVSKQLYININYHL